MIIASISRKRFGGETRQRTETSTGRRSGLPSAAMEESGFDIVRSDRSCPLAILNANHYYLQAMHPERLHVPDDRSPPGADPESASPRAVPASGVQRRWSSEALFGRHDEIVIDHRRREYRLRITQNGKLILNA
ncbi:MAG: hemin uptake protein HemP [Lautropia sp.]